MLCTRHTVPYRKAHYSEGFREKMRVRACFIAPRPQSVTIKSFGEMPDALIRRQSTQIKTTAPTTKEKAHMH